MVTYSSDTLKQQTQNAHFDVVILGGGPAGTATALALRNHAPEFSIALVERSDYQAVRIGETLPPTVQPLLQQLGVWELFLAEGHLAAYGSCSAWGSRDLAENEFIYNPLGRGWHLDRARFDAGLARAAAAAGVAVYHGTKFITSHEIDDGRWRLEIQPEADPPFTLDASFVVDATGRRAGFARQHDAKRVLLDQLLGTTVFFKLTETPLTDTYTLVEAVEDGWWYSALVPDGKIAVVYMSDSDLIKQGDLSSVDAWHKRLDATRYTKARLNGAEPLNGPAVHPAYSHRLDRMVGHNWLAVGDAAMTYDPLSSLGIFKGLRSGIMAAYAIGDHFRGLPALNKYAAILAGEFESYLKTRGEFYREEQRWPDSQFWQRRFDYVTLDPGLTLKAVGQADQLDRFEKYPRHLPAVDLKALHTLCATPRPAREVVSAFAARGSLVSDRRVILALQFLLEKELIAPQVQKENG